jgi:hypothetical protein
MWQCCSDCKSDYAVDFEAGGDLHICPNCLKKHQTVPPVNPDFFAAAPKPPVSPLWTVGFILALVVFLAQLYFVERIKIAQDPDRRAAVDRFCQTVPCGLPVYKNLDELEILHGDFQLNGNSHYLFETVISNQASFAQAYPRIKLILLDFSGHAFAQRVFSPTEYLKISPTQLMAASQTVEVSLKIAIPKQKVGGYTFELL